MMVLKLSITLFFLLGSQIALAKPHPDPKLPGLVDLGYAKHVPTEIKTTKSGRKIAVYKNIRFANSPTGERRFRLPDTNLPTVTGIQDGNITELSNSCISSTPTGWPFPWNGTTWGQEDCLFLDVWVPEGVKPRDKVPVLHWFVGSAWAFGSKEMYSSPIGLFDVMDDNDPFIYVANNYRLGVPGWTYLPGQDMVANLGMHDCHAAAIWTSKYIGRFGGDSKKVTAMGQSAGAGIIGLLTVLNEGKGKLPFQQAFVSSPCTPPRRHLVPRQQMLFDSILDQANCTSLKCLRLLPEQSIRDLNDHFINVQPPDAGGGVLGPNPGFGPTVDGSFIADMPHILYQKGKYHKELKRVIVGNTLNEGMHNSNDTGMPNTFPYLVRQILTTASDDTVAYIQSHYNYADNPSKLAWDWSTDAIFACPAANIAAAYSQGDKARRYIFSAPPATHGQDSSYYFYQSQDITPVQDPSLAIRFQKGLIDFIYERAIDEWPVYGRSGQEKIRNITDTLFDDGPLPVDLRTRCSMVNEVISDEKNGV